MIVIDADAHVEEGIETWNYLDPAWHRWRPFPVVFPENTVFGSHNGAWIIEFKMRLVGGTPTVMKRAQEKGATIPAQELTDIKKRLAYMSEQGIDKQVVFPTLWQGPVAENVELEAALARSWNTFMATQCGQSEGRLWFVAVVPFRRPDLAAEELRRVKALGSVAGVYAHGMEWDMPLSHPAMWPIFEEAERQDLPIMVHTGNGAPSISRILEGIPRPDKQQFPQVNPWSAGLSSGPLYAFQQLLGSSLMEDFPRLRLAFLETGSDWTPRLVKILRQRKGNKIDEWMGERVFVACAVYDDLSYNIDKLGDDFLVTASDFPHGDAFREDHLAVQLEKRGDLKEKTIQKILSGNPQRLFRF